MIDLSRFFEFYAHRQNEFQTAWNLVGQSFTLITFETFAIVFCEKFGIVGTPAIMIYVVAPIAAVVCVIYLGHTMIRSGYANVFYKAQQNLNKDWENHLKETAIICKKLQEMEKDEQHAG
jgi:hypothetical protein